MKHTFFLVLSIAAAGCTSGDASQIPGADTDPVSGTAASALTRLGLSPCGYSTSGDLVDFDGAVTHSASTATVTYDQEGRDILEEVVDANGLAVTSTTTEYDAMGNPVRWHDVRPDGETDLWLAYDSFGRLLRYSGDEGADGTEEWVATYTYGADGRRTGARLVQASGTYERAYRYGADGRLAELDRDDGPDGVIDAHTVYSYDDDARVQTRTTTNAAGAVVGTGSTTYDDANRAIAVLDTRPGADYSSTSWSNTAYGADRVLTQDSGGDTVREVDQARQQSTNHLIWQYDGCR
ncbi:MAG: hypothetical protein K8W52_29040 [Deltaproteobacteria bacterium]|nr:hypothetical protein [Deltaproteobacteria bacterium]